MPGMMDAQARSRPHISRAGLGVSVDRDTDGRMKSRLLRYIIEDRVHACVVDHARNSMSSSDYRITQRRPLACQGKDQGLAKIQETY